METIKAKYKGRAPGSSVEINVPDLDMDLNRMICWIMTKPKDALNLVPEFYRLRGEGGKE